MNHYIVYAEDYHVDTYDYSQDREEEEDES